MNPLNAAAWEIHTYLAKHNIPHVIIGGLAVQRWGEPRNTKDVDVTVSVPPEQSDDFVSSLVQHFRPRISNAVEFARRSRVVLLSTSNGYDIDLSLGIPGYEDDVIAHAVEYELKPGKTVPLCSAEDLIIHKAVAGRPVDIQDVESIVLRQREQLNVRYVRMWLREFAEVLGKPDLPQLFEKPWKRLRARKK